MMPDRTRTTRRAFLWTATLGGLAALVGDWLPRRWLTPPVSATPFRIAGAGELPTGSAMTFTVPGTTIPGVLVRTAADTFVAFDQRCPHLGCPVQWSRQLARFECPCHKAIFNGADGAVLAGPPRRGLRRITIEQRGDEVWALHPVAADELAWSSPTPSRPQAPVAKDKRTKGVCNANA